MNSFRLAKKDIIKLQNEVIETNQTQKKLIAKLDSLAAKLSKAPKTVQKTKTIVKTVSKHAKKKFVASKEGKKFHMTHCPFALNIKPKSKVIFKSRDTALNNGYKPCKCVK